MSWMRSPVYAWGSGNLINHRDDWVHLWVRRDCENEATPQMGLESDPDDSDYPDFSAGIRMRQDVFDALVLFRYAQLAESPTEMRRAKRYAKSQLGNLGTLAYEPNQPLATVVALVAADKQVGNTGPGMVAEDLSNQENPALLQSKEE